MARAPVAHDARLAVDEGLGLRCLLAAHPRLGADAVVPGECRTDHRPVEEPAAREDADREHQHALTTLHGCLRRVAG